MSDNALVFSTAIDLLGLDRDLRTAEGMIDDFAAAAASRLNIPSARIQVEGGVDPGQMASSIAPLVGMVRSALGEAVGPLHAFAAEFRTQFAEVGATVERLSIRIDDAMRFPKFIARVDAFRSAMLSRFGLTMKGVGDEVAKGAARVEADATKFVKPFAVARQAIKKEVKPIPSEVGHALEAATHVDAKGSFKSYLAGLDEVRSSAIDKMKQMADAVQNATGKGSRKAKWKARDQAAGLGSSIASVPPRQMATPATKAPGPTAWEMVGKAARAAGTVASAVHVQLSNLARQDARDVDRIIATWRKFEQIKSTISTFGSVANATFGKLAKIPAPKLSIDPRQSAVLQGIGGAARSAGAGFKSMGDQVALAFGIYGLVFKAASAFAFFFKSGTKGASDLNETTSKTRVILGTASGSVESFADEMAGKFGLVKGTTLDTAASMAGLGKSIGGLRGESLAGFSKQFTKLAADLSSFSNIDMSAAGDAIRTGLAGNQSDQLKELGVILTEDTTKAYAYAHGIAKVGQELSEQEKFAARAGLITRGLAKASGDLERTQGGAANQGRKLWGSIENLATSVGSALLPAFTEGLNLLNEFGTWAATTFEANKGVVQGWSDSIINSFDWVVAVVHNFPSAFEVARLKVYEGLVNIGEYFAALGPNIAIVAEYIANNWTKLLADAFHATIAGLKNLWTNWQAVGTAIGEWFADPTAGFHVNWTPLLDGFKATAEKFPQLLMPALTDMSKEIAAAARPITDEVANRRSAREAAKAIGPKAVEDDGPADDLGKKEKKEKKEKNRDTFAGALELGSKEAYSSVVSARAGRSEGMDAIERSGHATAGNTAELVRLQAKANRVNGGPKKNLVI